MGTLLHEINDSVYLINGEGLYIDLQTEKYQGLYDLKGIDALMYKALKDGEDIKVLEDARSILRAYRQRMTAPYDLLIPNHDDGVPV